MKKTNVGKDSILNSQIFQKYKEEMAKDHDFSDLDKQIKKKDKKDANLGRS